jgi:hypothetical protein
MFERVEMLPEHVLDERSYAPRMYPFGRSVMKTSAFAPAMKSALGDVPESAKLPEARREKMAS